MRPADSTIDKCNCTISKDQVLEPPETPAPVFALRAFKSVLFGTPADEESGKSASQSNKASQPSGKINTFPIPIKKQEPVKTEPDQMNLSGSPSKSILVTPGTTSHRRKTVSFGESVVDNEGKREDFSSNLVKTPPNASGNITAQWTSLSSDGKPQSKLTQTLMAARDNALKNSESDANPVASAQLEANIEDDTLNLSNPRSESGQYWKTEYENYRLRTNQEIKKLIQYRSVAKNFARKKDSEASRLAGKLKEEEKKVADLERQVADLKRQAIRPASTNSGDLEKDNETLKQENDALRQEKDTIKQENHTLKQTMARVKQEMSRYDGRRKEKENKLKQREVKLEERIQDYRERLKISTQEHRQSEEALRKNFDDERHRMQNRLDLLKDMLKENAPVTDRVPILRPQQRHSFSPRKEYKEYSDKEYKDYKGSRLFGLVE
ncbi:hypothetical protein N7495_001097 [Penicillium taxi]|uniref:uncharacterized protein n=1 Tax=Penicillium taxi TaxID=168475 RepID=UPI002545B139|nr:uncharacterized protein N7495_001097 [Penicillium taxi]KAJ5908415.1 hypothetical protein N7495_001097 [Penicillium taxi]